MRELQLHKTIDFKIAVQAIPVPLSELKQFTRWFTKDFFHFRQL